MTDMLVSLSVVAVVAVGMLLAIPHLLVPRGNANRAKCANNLEQIGRAIAAYYGCTNDYYPFIESDYATDSLTLLYPDFTANLTIFKCPATEDVPEVAMEFAALFDDAGLVRLRTWFGDEAGRALEAPKWSSYGYDDRVHHAHAGANHVVAGDMDASFATGKGKTSNHRGGGNYLRFDGHVSFETSVYCSNNPLDNIYAWNADGKTWYAETDSWIRRP